VKTPFDARLAVFDDKPCFVLDIKVLGTDTNDPQHVYNLVPIAIPMHNEANDVPMPHLSNARLFFFHPLHTGITWLSHKLRREKQDRTSDIAKYVVVTTHLAPIERRNLIHVLVSEIGPMFNITLLVPLGEEPSMSDGIASYNPET
jgi:hypothetical protein